MVMRADMVMVIRQEEDKQWRIVNETLIKAKSVRGYRWVRGGERRWTVCPYLTIQSVSSQDK